jgi:hypothetical protein
MRVPKELRTSVNLLILGTFILLGLGGCGNSTSASPAGIYIDGMTQEYLKQSFDETKSCTALTEGKFEDLSVGMMPPFFPCSYYSNGCSGEFVEPNTVKVGSLYSWRHELVHYLLYINTGDADQSHRSPLFDTCGINPS